MKQCLVILVVIALPGAALAYIGPGAGISAIGTVLALTGALLLLLVGFIWYPLKRLFRRFGEAMKAAETEHSERCSGHKVEED